MGLAAGAATGAFLGYSVDAFNYGVGMEFIEEVSRNLTPGKSTIIAEVDEFGTLGLDLKMEALGGIVVRQWRLDVEEERDLIENEVQARNASFPSSRRSTHKPRTSIRLGWKPRSRLPRQN